MNKINLLIMLLVFKVGAQTPTLTITDSLYAVGNYSEAIQQLEDIPDPSEVIYSSLAKSYLAVGNLSSALRNYKKVLIENPNKVLTIVDYGETLVRAGKLKSADSLFQKLINKHPKTASFQFQLGEIKEKHKDSTYLDYY